MKEIKTIHQRLAFDDIAGLPEIDLLFTACRVSESAHVIDLLDFRTKSLDRWTLPIVDIPAALALLSKEISRTCVPFGLSHEEFFRNHLMAPHTAQLSDQGKLFVCLGDFFNGLCTYVIDTESHRTRLFPGDFAEEPMLYTATGDFTPDGRHWLFARWPFAEALAIENGRSAEANLEISRVRIADLAPEILCTLRNRDRIHQITCAPDSRHVVFCPFRWVQRTPYPAVAMDQDPAAANLKSNAAGTEKDAVVTVDLRTGRHWRTEIPVPVPAHLEFDPVEAGTFYLSAHHFHPLGKDVVLEGPGAIFKMKIQQGRTEIVGRYSDDQFFRLSQHAPFSYRDRTLIAVTNLPNKLDLIDAGSMTLWRRVELFSAPILDQARTGSILCPTYPGSSYSVNPSRDGRYIVMENSMAFRIYDLDKNRWLDCEVPRFLPTGCRGMGHTRLAGA
ncbi:MAG: hypothetical protein A2521_05045 [Deltaproteobacteria bacterium RIFOXYD12_FULL_57_12]|nr:MAG: hypothetical protein A2521_05045 [Deltaproteobacteria bacterium RIFOXYD12_FULL_57_12]